jgi:hypothetical protein
MKNLIFGGKDLRNQSINQSINQSLKALALFVVLAMASSSASAQIKVAANGKVGLCTSTTSSSDGVYVVGSMLFASTYGSSLRISSYYTTPTLAPMANNTGYLGTSSLQFNEIRGQYHYATGVLLTSDKRFKENFRSIEKPLDKILKMNGQEYDFILDESDTTGTKEEQQKRATMKKDKMGFIAQELKEVLPEAVVYEEAEDRYYIDYIAVIPVIVEAMKE